MWESPIRWLSQFIPSCTSSERCNNMSGIPVQGGRIKKNKRGSDRYADDVWSCLHQELEQMFVPHLRYELKCKRNRSRLRTFETPGPGPFLKFALGIYAPSMNTCGVAMLMVTMFLYYTIVKAIVMMTKKLGISVVVLGNLYACSRTFLPRLNIHLGLKPRRTVRNELFRKKNVLGT